MDDKFVLTNFDRDSHHDQQWILNSAKCFNSEKELDTHIEEVLNKKPDFVNTASATTPATVVATALLLANS